MSVKHRIGFIHNGLPNIYSGGSDFFAFSMLKELSAMGYAITCIPSKIFKYDDKRIYADLETNNINHISIAYEDSRSENIDSSTTKKTLKLEFLKKRLRSYFFSFRKKSKIDPLRMHIENCICQEAYDVVVVFDNDNIVASSSLKLRKIAILGDPINLVSRFRIIDSRNWQNPLQNLVYYMNNRLRYIGYLSWLVNHAKKYDKVFTLAFHERKLFRSSGLHDCSHLHMPVIDIAQEYVFEIVRTHDIVTISMVGGLASNFNGIRALGKYFVPLVYKHGLADKVSVKIVGSIPNKIPSDIEEIINDKLVEATGYVDNIDDLLLTTDVLIYPINHPVGVRTKIILASSFRCAIATHSSSSKGIPELKDGVNSIISGSYEELSEKLIKVIGDRSYLESLKEGARTMYEKNYYPRISIRPMVKSLNKLIG